MFEKASRKKLRFDTQRGTLSAEDLWDLSLEGLDEIVTNLSKQAEESREESFIKKRTVVGRDLSLRFDIVKRVIEVRLQEAENAEKLMKLVAQKPR